MANTRGVFTLQEVRYALEDEAWVDVADAYTQAASVPITVYETGYFGGGNDPSVSPSYITTVDKITYSTDTTSAVPGAALSYGRDSHAATGTQSVGYFGGGNSPAGTLTIVDKLTYSTETTARIPGADLTIARYYNTAVTSEQAGYFVAAAPLITSTDKLTYSSDTTAAAPAINTSQPRHYINGTGTPGSALVAAGYCSPSQQKSTTVDKLTFSYDVMARIPVADLPTATRDGKMSGDSRAAYYGGGVSHNTSIVKITYSSETSQTLPANLTVTRNQSAATSSSSAAYFAGGTASYTTVEKLDYTTETSTSTGTNLTAQRRHFAATSSRGNVLPTQTTFPTTNLNGVVSGPNLGYFGGGGLPAGSVSYVYRANFSTDTLEFATGAPISQARTGCNAAGNTTNGYFGGSDSASSRIDKFTYSSETSAANSSNLTNARGYSGAAGNLSVGYFAGGAGVYPTKYSTTDKITFSTDAVAAVPGAALSSAISGMGGAGNPGALYNGGGSDGSGRSYMQKLTYSTETTTNIPAAQLSTSRHSLTATGNATAGYFGSGSPQSTVVDRCTYSTDTTVRIPGCNLVTARSFTSATGNADQGYIAGGYDGSNYRTEIDKISYATDTAQAVPGMYFPTAIGANGGVSAREDGLPFQAAATPTNAFSDASTAPNTGYFGGGNPVTSIMDKLNYSTETMEAVSGANLSVARGNAAGTGNLTNGYFGGGFAPGPSLFSTMDKLTYSTDTTAAVSGAALSVARHSASATSSSTAGYIGGGNPTSSTMDKLTYSSDTTTAVPGAALDTAVFYVAAEGNSSAGYFGGGRNPGLSPINITNMQKLTYSSDTTARLPGSSLTAARYGNAAAGNSDVGYFVGGYSIGWYPSNALVSDVDKLTYSTDTLARVPGAGSAVAKGFMDGTGNSGAGYFAGGNIPADTTRTEKLTYSTETSADVPGSQISQAVWANAASSARANAIAATTNIV